MTDYQDESEQLNEPELVEKPVKEPQGVPVRLPVPLPVSAPAVAAGFGSPAMVSKVLDFGVNKTADPPTTPSTPFAASSSTEVDYNLFLLETLLWKNKVRSTLYFVLGLVGLLGLRFLVAAQATLLSSVGYLLLLSLCVNFMRSIISPPWQESSKWTGSALTNFAHSSIKATLNAASALHDAHFNGKDPVKTLQVAVGLWSVALLGRLVSGTDLLIAGFLLAFSLPVLYTKFKKVVDKAVGDVVSQVQVKYNALDRRSKAGVVLGPLILLMVLLSSRDRFAAIFLFLVYGRLLLKPVELEAITKRVEPITATAKRLGTAASNLAVDFADKHSLTPTPTKKKSQ